MSQDGHPIESVPRLIVRLYEIVDELERKFGRRFTPDGHLVGSIGEVVAAHRYGLSLLDHSAEGHDAKVGGILVQVKATQRSAVALRSEPQHLIVLHISPRGVATEIYNGPGAPVWGNAGPVQKNGQRAIGLSKLKKMAAEVAPILRLPQTNS